jgi:hypothetical protein
MVSMSRLHFTSGFVVVFWLLRVTYVQYTPEQSRMHCNALCHTMSH